MSMKDLLVSCPESGEVWPVHLDGAGQLSADPPLQLGCTCQAIATRRGDAYIACREGDRAFIRSIRDGVLHPDQTTTTGAPAYLTVSPCGKFLINASYHGNCVTVARLQPSGAVEAPVQCLEGLDKAHCCVYRPAGETLESHELWVPCLGLNCIKKFRQHKQTGRLEEIAILQPSAAGAGPRHLVFHPKLPVAYCVNELNGTVDAYHTEFDNVIETASAVPADSVGKPWAADIALTSDGRMLFVSERINSTIAVYTVGGGDGKLKRVSVLTTDARQPRAMRLVDDQWLLVAGQKSDNLIAYQLGRAGQLLKVSELSVGMGPMWIFVTDTPVKQPEKQ